MVKTGCLLLMCTPLVGSDNTIVNVSSGSLTRSFNAYIKPILEVTSGLKDTVEVRNTKSSPAVAYPVPVPSIPGVYLTVTWRTLVVVATEVSVGVMG